MPRTKKELRRMNRTELIEIIYALKQQQESLQKEKDQLTEQLKERAIRIDMAGSIAEAALSLNHIFEEAEAAAGQYLFSIQEAEAEAQKRLTEAEKKLSDAEEKLSVYEEKLSGAEVEAEVIRKNAQAEADKIACFARAEAESILNDARAEAVSLLDSAHKTVEEEDDR